MRSRDTQQELGSENLKGTIVSVLWRSQDDDYAIMRVQLPTVSQKTKSDEAIVKGTIIEATQGASLDCSGRWVNGSRGWQFQAQDILDSIPTHAKGIEAYLSSNKVPGVGSGFARKIVAAFGALTWDVIEQSPWKLKQIKGLGEKRRNSLVKAVKENKAIYEIMSTLRGFDVKQAQAVKIYKKWGSDSIKQIKSNPYAICEIPGIGFKSADEIAQSVGVDPESEFRIKAALLYALEQQAQSGNTFVDLNRLVTTTAGSILQIDDFVVAAEINTLISEKLIVKQEMDGQEYVGLSLYHNAENSIVNSLKRISSTPNPWRNITPTITNQKLVESQRSAIQSAFQDKVLVITGGPGMGKTTIMKEIIENAKAQNAKIKLVAPTGRASGRLSESTGEEASTIHRALGVTPVGFSKNEENPIDCDLIVVDESSMADTLITASFLKAIPDHAVVVIVGDKDQLPSVGAGNVLNDLIESNVINVARLTKIFRQAEGSKIITGAYDVRDGKMPDIKTNLGDDFHFIRADTNEQIAHEIINLVDHTIPQTYGIEPKDIQVLSPMVQNAVGTTELNKLIQDRINPDGISISKWGAHYRKHDRIMQLTNNYDLDVFNGDLGEILKVNKEEGTLDVKIEGKNLTLDQSDLNDIVHAYAATIHKSQGSEYKAVIIPVTTSHTNMLNRNLLFTGMTRGKQLLILVGQELALKRAVSRRNDRKRVTGLKHKLQQAMPAKDLGDEITKKRSRHDIAQMEV